MAQNWWESAPLVAPANDPAFTGYIPGNPKPEKPEAPPSGYRRNADGSLTPIPGGPADPRRPGGELDPNKATGDGKSTGEAKAAAGYFGRMLNAHKLYGQGLEPRSVPGQIAADILPRGVVNTFSSPERRAADNYAQEFIRAKLRKESGASIAPDEQQREYETYFPVPGDGPEDLARKAALREQAIEGMRLAAGPEAENIRLVGDSGIPTGTTTYAPQGEGPKGDRATPEQEQALLAFVREHPGDPEAINAFAKANGFPYGVNAEELAGAKSLAGGINYSKVDEAAEARARAELEAQKKVDPASDTDAGTLVNSGASFALADEAAGVGRGLSFALQGRNPVEGYQLGRDAERLRIADARKQLGYGGTALEVAGGFLSANPTSVLAPFVSRADTILQGAKSGAGTGALAGWGSGEGLEGSTTNAITGGVVGLGLGTTVSTVATRSGKTVDPALAQAALDENVRAPRLLIEGSRRDINRAGRLEADQTTAPIIQEGFGNVADDIGAGVERLGRGGVAQDRATAGEDFRQIAKEIQRIDKEGSTSAYAAAEAIQPDAVVDPVSMRAAIDKDLARLRRTPNSNEDQIRTLEKYRRDLENPLPLQAVRDLRTSARDNISGLNIARSSGAKAADRRMMSIIDGSKDDIERALTPEAQTAWKAADKEYSENQTFYRQALKPFFGDDFDKLPAEAIFDRIKGAANNNGRALAALHRRLTPEQSRNFAATLAESLGRRSPDEPFSPVLFMQQARKYSPSARETIFGPSGKASFDNLLKLSRRLQTIQSEVNRSKTARPVGQVVREQAGNVITALLTGAGGLHSGGQGAVVGAGAGIALNGAMQATGAVRRTLSAKALMNPRVTNWLLRAANVNTRAQAQQQVQRLGVIISREPALSGELQPLQRWLQESLRPAAASEREDQSDDR